MKRKIIPLLLICALLLLTACNQVNPLIPDTAPTPAVTEAEPSEAPVKPGKTPEPEEELTVNQMAHKTYTDVSRVISAALREPSPDDNIDMDFVDNTNFEMDIFGEKLAANNLVQTKGNIKMVIEDGITKYALVAETGGILQSFGQSFGDFPTVTVELYYDGENSYFAVDGEQIEVSEDELDMLDISPGNITEMPNIRENEIISVETRSVGGNMAMVMIIDGEALTEYASDMIDMTDDLLSVFGNNAKMTYEDGSVTIVSRPDGTPLSVEMYVVIIVSSDAGYYKHTSTMTYYINEIGRDVTIDFPEGMG